MAKDYVDITENISVEKFEIIVAFILKEGDFKLYSNRYGFSPHYKLNEFNVYLAPSHEHINSIDAFSKEVSDYNTIVIQDNNSEIIYYHIILKGDVVVLKLDDRHKVIQRKKLTDYLLAIEQTLESKMGNTNIDVTSGLSVEDFKAIAATILKDGDRRFYCNKYNYSPHYKIDEDIDLYLDPINQSTNLTPERNSNEVSDYNTIVIYDSNGDAFARYKSIMLQGDTVVLMFDEDDGKDRAYVREIFLNKYLPAIEKIFKLE